MVFGEIVNRDIALCEVSNRVDNDAVRPNNKDRSMGWFGTKPVMKLTNRHWKIVVFAGQRTTLRIVLQRVNGTEKTIEPTFRLLDRAIFRPPLSGFK